jgi:hypothetical protein
MTKLYEQRKAMRERVEVCVVTGTCGETWVDLQDWLDNMLMIPAPFRFTQDGPITLTEYKQKCTPEPR